MHDTVRENIIEFLSSTKEWVEFLEALFKLAPAGMSFKLFMQQTFERIPKSPLVTDVELKKIIKKMPSPLIVGDWTRGANKFDYLWLTKSGKLQEAINVLGNEAETNSSERPLEEFLEKLPISQARLVRLVREGVNDELKLIRRLYPNESIADDFSRLANRLRQLQWRTNNELMKLFMGQKKMPQIYRPRGRRKDGGLGKIYFG